MSERPGPSPEELENPEQIEAAKLYRQGFDSIRRVVSSHPSAFVEYEEQLIEGKMTEIPINKRLELTDIGGFGRIEIWLESEAGDTRAKGGIEFIEEGLPAEERDEYNFLHNGEISYYTDSETKAPLQKIDMNARRSLIKQITLIEHELQQCGEI